MQGEVFNIENIFSDEKYNDFRFFFFRGILGVVKMEEAIAEGISWKTKQPKGAISKSLSN